MNWYNKRLGGFKKIIISLFLFFFFFLISVFMREWIIIKSESSKLTTLCEYVKIKHYFHPPHFFFFFLRLIPSLIRLSFMSLAQKLLSQLIDSVVIYEALSSYAYTIIRGEAREQVFLLL